MNAMALKALLNDRTAYEVVEASVPRARAGKRELITVNAPEFAPWSA
jgi:UDP-3-O-[3-hydroxymyristoyl] N-acetylglucosamine deacetylase